MSEAILVIVFLITMLAVTFIVKRTPQPTRLYVRVGAGMLLLALVWFTGETRMLALKFLFTIIVISSWYRAYWEYKKDKSPEAPVNSTPED